MLEVEHTSQHFPEVAETALTLNNLCHQYLENEER